MSLVARGRVQAESFVVGRVGEDTARHGVSIGVNVELIVVRLVEFQIDRSADVGNESANSLALPRVGMPNGAVSSVDHVGVLIRPVGEIRAKVEPFDFADILNAFIAIGIEPDAVVDQKRIRACLTNLQ